MAVGARISSENLSGKTATVTFTPYTGTTSGTTVDLGEKTIPFNNITSHPYGDYAIYLPEYDYTYTLNIPEPVVASNLFVIVDRMRNDNNYGAAVFNYDDFTAEIIDLGVDSTVYDNRNLYPLQNNGYACEFRNDGDNNSLVIFTDATNTEIGRYTGTTSNWDVDDLDGKWGIMYDYDNGVITYSNGLDVYTYTYDNERYEIDLQWDYDATMSNSSFVIIKYDLGQGTDHHAVLFKSDGTQTTLKSWTAADAIDYNFLLQYNSDFYVVEKWDTNNNQFVSTEIFHISGNLYETVEFTGNTYNNKNYGFYGTNKYYSIYYNDNDNTIPYNIIDFNSNTTFLIQTGHTRNNEYANIFVRYDNSFWPNWTNNSEGLFIAFYDLYNNNWTNWGFTVSYCDFLYKLPTQSTFNQYVFADDETKTAYVYNTQNNDIIRLGVGNGDGVASVFTITTGNTINIQSLGINVSDIAGTSVYYLQNRTAIQISYDNYNSTKIIIIDSDGTIMSQIDDVYPYQYGNANTSGDSNNFYAGYESTVSGYTGYYFINGVSTGLTQTEYYMWQNDADEWFSPTFDRPVGMVLYNFDNDTARVLSSSGISSQISMSPTYGDRGIEVGDNKFLHYYNDADGYYHIKLYDFDGNLLNTLNTTYTDYNNIYAVKDRFLASFYNSNDNYYDYYMISETSTANLMLDDYDREWTPNDYIWWNNW